MPPRPHKSAAGEEYLNWTDDEVLLHLNVAVDYKTQSIAHGKDWESVQTKYLDISERLKEHLRKYRETGGDGRDYPHNPDDMSKDKVSTKLKAIRTKYRNAVDSGRKSGHGRVVMLYFEECQQLWGGSPATSKIGSGIESFQIEENSIEIATEMTTTSDISTKGSQDSSDDESSSCSVTPVSVTETTKDPSNMEVIENERIGKRRAQLDSLLTSHKRKKMEKKVSAETQFISLAKEEIELKKEMMKQQRQLDEEYKKTLTTLAGVMETLGKSISEGPACLQHAFKSPQRVPMQQAQNFMGYSQAASSQMFQNNYRQDSFLAALNNNEWSQNINSDQP